MKLVLFLIGNTIWFFSGVAFLCTLAEPLLGYRGVGFIFLAGVLLVGMVGSRGPVFFSALISALTWNFFFIPPRFTLVIGSPEDTLLCISYFIAALITGFLANKVRIHESRLWERSQRSDAVFSLLKLLTKISSSTAHTSVGLQIPTILTEVETVLHGQCLVLLTKGDGSVERILSSHVEEQTLSNSEIESIQIASRANPDQMHHLEKGDGLDLFSLPLMGAHGSKGALVLIQNRKDVSGLINIGEDLRVFADFIAFSLNGDRRGSDENLKDGLAWRESLRMDSVKLLTQVSSEKGLKEPISLKDLIALSLTRIDPALGNSEFDIHIQPDVPDVNVDRTLFQYAFTKLLDAVIGSSGPNRAVRITSGSEGSAAYLLIENNLISLVESEIRQFSRGYDFNLRDRMSLFGTDITDVMQILAGAGCEIKANNLLAAGIQIQILIPADSASRSTAEKDHVSISV